LLSSVTMTSGSGSTFASAGVTATGATISSVAITAGADSTNNFGTLTGASVITSSVITVGYGSTVNSTGVLLDADTISSVAITYNSGSTSTIEIGTTGDKLSSVTMAGYATSATLDVNGATAVVSASGMTSAAIINSVGTTAATITGGSGADSITAGSGTDSITGGAGADSIVGGGGADTISGGAGEDSISLGSGNAVVKIANTDSGLLSSTNLTQLANGTATTLVGFDHISGFNTGDILSLSSFSGATINAAFTSGETPTADKIVMIKGVYNATNNTFDSDATSEDATLMVWDSSIDGTAAYRAIILIGYVGTDTATNVTYTGITGVA
jgi:hypothetical protein